jgi:hypothetical protein
MYGLRYLPLFCLILLLISCNEKKETATENISQQPVKTTATPDTIAPKQPAQPIKYIEISELVIGNGYTSHSTLAEFKQRFKEIDSTRYSIDEMNDGDTITMLYINGGRFTYFDSLVYFDFLDLDKIDVTYQGLTLNSIHIDSLRNVEGISFGDLETSHDAANNEIARSWFSIHRDKPTSEQIILVFIDDRLRQIRYFNGND